MGKISRWLPVALLVLYFLTRFSNLLHLPLFNDEAFFIWTAKKIISNPAGNIFINFSDGKEPLFFWIFTIPMKLFFDRALLGGRIFSIVCGLITLLFLWKAAKKLLPQSASILAGLAFVLSPFLLLYQRLATQESFLLAILGYVLYQIVIWSEKPTVKNSLFLGIGIGLALLTKTNSFTFIFFAIPLGWYFLDKKKIEHVWQNIIWVLITTGLLYCLIFLRPESRQIISHNSAYVGLISLTQFIVNLKSAGKWLIEFQGVPLITISLLAPFLVRAKRGLGIALWILAFGPVIAESAVAKIFFPRYFIFSLLPLSLLTGLVFGEISTLAKSILPRYRGLVTLLVTVLIFLPNLQLSWAIINHIETAGLPPIERWQYLTSWPAGYGLEQSANFLKSNGPKTIVVENIMLTYAGLPYFWPGVGERVEVYSWSPEDKIFPDKFRSPKYAGAYFVFDLRQDIPADWPLVKLAAFPKVEGKENISIYRRI